MLVYVHVIVCKLDVIDRDMTEVSLATKKTTLKLSTVEYSTVQFVVNGDSPIVFTISTAYNW